MSTTKKCLNNYMRRKNTENNARQEHIFKKKYFKKGVKN